MINRFFDCLPFILAREGGKTDDPTDRGGRTAYGITQATYSTFTETMNDVWDITPEEVAAIYHTRYWDACQCDNLPKGLDLCVFDSAVQHGPGTAAKFLQRALGVAADGAIGPTTLAALSASVGPAALIDQYLAQRQDYYAAIIAAHPEQAKYAHGWANRITALKQEIGNSV